ncbi:MAG: QueT transporter family protein [Oscillospiraceae bacterium]|nr:QueT transporter family protein [Oscillospiraceae bacterium]
MKSSVRYMAYGALIAAMYAALTHLQNILLPGSATWAIQFRASEALCVLAFFTPAAIPGLTVGCFLFNLTFAGALPLDAPIGSLATLLAAWGMYLARGLTVKGLPLLGLCLPALTNAVLVGWELTAYVGGGFWMNAAYVAIGEGAVLLTLGGLLYAVLKKHRLGERIFAES